MLMLSGLWRSLFLGLPAVALFLSSYPVEAEPMFTGLGNLPGGGSPSVAHSISADGSTVIGESDGASGAPIAFRWTASMVLVMALMHYWYDGFIWSVRKREV